MKIWTNKDVWGRSYLLKVGSQRQWYDTVDYDDDHVDGEEHPGEDCDDNDDDHDVDEEHLGRIMMSMVMLIMMMTMGLRPRIMMTMMKSTWARMPRIKRVEAPPRKLLVVPELNWALVK